MLLDLSRKPRKKTISLTPLIDVVFILLLFFMLSSSFVHLRQIDVSAMTETKQQLANNKPLIVQLINNQGDFKFRGQLTSMHNKQQVSDIVGKNAKAIFVVESRNGIKAQTMITLLDAFKQAGAKSVTLAGING